MSARINQQIKSKELRVIDEAGNNLGIMTLSEALSKAQAVGLDLIEISPTAQPPVAKIMSFDKYRYQEAKKLKETKKHQKKQEFKQVQIGLGSAINDLNMRANQAREFLNKGHQVTIRLALFGREKGKKDLAHTKLKNFLSMLEVEHKIVSQPSFSNRGLMVTIIKK